MPLCISDREIIEPDMTWLNDDHISDHAAGPIPVSCDIDAVQPPLIQSSQPPLTEAALPTASSPVAQPPATDLLATPTCTPAAQPPAVMSTAIIDLTTPPTPEAPGTLESIQSADPPEPELDSIALEILGEDPKLEVKYGKEIQKDVAVRLEHTAVTGLSKELRKELTAKYLTPANCTLIDPPALNAEIKAAATELVVKRDKAIEFKQKQLASVITCLGQAISRLITNKEKDTELLKMLMDASRILCDCQHTDSNTRKSFMLSTLKPDMKAQLQNTKIDKFLFGENLQETIKSAKVINKSGLELKSSVGARQQSQAKRPAQPAQNRNLNWKSPLPGRRLTPGAPRTREPAPAPGPSTPSPGYHRPPPPPPRPHASSYRQSQNRPANYRR